MSALASAQREFIDRLYGDGACERGLEIYRRNLRANLGGALGSTYPVVLRLVGDAFFREAAHRYVLAQASTSGDLNDYGADFAAFLARYEHARDLGYLPDVARLEWACHESYRAADAPALDFAALAQVPPDAQATIRFRLHPAVRLVESRHPVASIWQANQPGNDGTPARTEGGEQVLVRRDQGVVRVEVADAARWQLADAFAHGCTLAEAGETLGDALPAMLADFASAGVIAGFDVPRGA